MQKLLLTAFSLALLFTSCKKDDNDSSERKNNLIGTWRISALGVDSNNNGTLEPNERSPKDTSNVVLTQYLHDGSYRHYLITNHKDTNIYYADWALESEGSVLSIISNKGFPNQLEMKQQIISMTNKELILFDNRATVGQQYAVFVKL